MASYKIEWKHSVEKELKSIDRQYLPQIIEAVDALSNNPFPPQYRKLHGVESTYRIRVGDYRIIYQVDTKIKSIVISLLSNCFVVKTR
jgi:mRNA interferase RelE/StbE